MGFFDRQYRYSLERPPLWKSAGTLINSVTTLSHLYGELRVHLRKLLASDGGEPKWDFSDVPTTLTQALIEAFPSSAVVSAQDTWLLAFCHGARSRSARSVAGVVRPRAGKNIPLPTCLRRRCGSRYRKRRRKSLTVRLLEPLLGEMDLLFNLMLTESIPGEVRTRDLSA